MGNLLNGFDAIMKGGLRENTIYLITGLPGTGKTSLVETLAKEFLEDGRKVCYIVTNLMTDSFMEHVLSSFRQDFEQNLEKHLTIVGLCPSDRNQHPGELCLDPSDLISCIKTLNEKIDKKKAGDIVIVDSLSSFFLYNNPAEVMKFIQIMNLKLRGAGASLFSVVEEGIHADTIINTLGFSADGVFETRIRQSDGDFVREFRVRTLRTATHMTPWIPVKITDDGFAFEKLPEGGIK